MVARINTTLRRVPTWPLYVLFALPAPWLVYLGATGGLGVEPIKALEHELGLLALQFLIAGLAVTPLRRFVGVNLIRFRRLLGLSAFYYVGCHLLVWLVLDVQILAQIWADILKRPYITIGMIAFLLLIPLAVTSSDRAVRRLGPIGWRRLHRLAYPAALLAVLHFVMLRKGLQIEPLIYAGVICALLVMRMQRQGKRRVA